MVVINLTLLRNKFNKITQAHLPHMLFSIFAKKLMGHMTHTLLLPHQTHTHAIHMHIHTLLSLSLSYRNLIRLRNEINSRA